MPVSKSNSCAVSPSSSNCGTVDFNRLTLQSPPRSVMSQISEAQMENCEEENDDVLIIDEASTPAHASESTETFVPAPSTNAPMTNKEQIDAMILDENMTVEEMLNSNIMKHLPTMSNSLADNMLDEDDIFAENFTENKGCIRGSTQQQEELFLVEEAANSCVEPEQRTPPEQVAAQLAEQQNTDPDSNMPPLLTSPLREGAIDFGGLSNFQPAKFNDSAATQERTQPVEGSNKKAQNGEMGGEQGVNATVGKPFGLEIRHHADNIGSAHSSAADCPNEEQIRSSSEQEDFGIEVIENSNPATQAYSEENSQGYQEAVGSQEVNCSNNTSSSPQEVKPYMNVHSKRKKGSSKTGLVSSGGISKKRSTHKVKSAFVLPKQELEDTIRNTSPILPSHSTPDSGLGSPGIEIIEPTAAADVTHTVVTGNAMQTSIEDGAVDEEVEVDDLMLTDEIIILSCSGGEHIEATSSVPAVEISQHMSPSYMATEDAYDGLKEVPTDPDSMETQCGATGKTPDFQFNKSPTASTLPPKSMFGGGIEGINPIAKTPEEVASAKLKSFIRKNFPTPPNAEPLLTDTSLDQQQSSKRDRGQRNSLHNPGRLSERAGEQLQLPSPMHKAGRSERQRGVNRSNTQQKHEVIVLDESESDQEGQSHSLSKPSKRAFNSSPIPDDYTKKLQEVEQASADGIDGTIDAEKQAAGGSKPPLFAGVAGIQKGTRTYFPEPNSTQIHYSSGRYHQGRFFYKQPSRTPLLPMPNPPRVINQLDSVIPRYGGAWNPRGNQLPNLLPSFIPNIPLPPVNPTMVQQGQPIPVLNNRSTYGPVPAPMLGNVDQQGPPRWPSAAGFCGRSKSIASTARHMQTTVMQQNNNMPFTWRPPPANQIQPRSPERGGLPTPLVGAQRGRRATSVVTRSVTTHRIYHNQEPTPQVQRVEEREEQRSLSPNARRARAKSVAGDDRNAARRSRNYDMIRSSILQSRTRIQHSTHSNNGFSSRSKSCRPDGDFRSPISPVRYPSGSLGALLCGESQLSRQVDQQQQVACTSGGRRTNRYRSPSPPRSRHGRHEEDRSRHRSRRANTNGVAGGNRRTGRCATPFSRKSNGDGRRRRSESSSESDDSASNISSSSSSSSSSDNRRNRRAKRELSQMLSSLTDKLVNKKKHSSRSRSRRRAEGRRRSVVAEDLNNEPNHHHRVPSAYNELSLYQPSLHSVFSCRKRPNYKDEEESKRRRRYSSSSSDTSVTNYDKSSKRRKGSRKSSCRRAKKDDSKALLKAVKTIKKILGGK